MKKQTNIYWLIGITAAAGGLWYWNSQRLKKLRAKLVTYQAAPPPPSDRPKWLDILTTLYSLGVDIYGQFKPGGAFAGKLDQKTLDELLNYLKILPGRT